MTNSLTRRQSKIDSTSSQRATSFRTGVINLLRHISMEHSEVGLLWRKTGNTETWVEELSEKTSKVDKY